MSKEAPMDKQVDEFRRVATAAALLRQVYMVARHVDMPEGAKIRACQHLLYTAKIIGDAALTTEEVREIELAQYGTYSPVEREYVFILRDRLKVYGDRLTVLAKAFPVEDEY